MELPDFPAAHTHSLKSLEIGPVLPTALQWPALGNPGISCDVISVCKGAFGLGRGRGQALNFYQILRKSL